MTVRYAEDRGDRPHVIMDIHGRPVYVCRKDEVEKLFTDQFWQCFETWQYYHNGFGLPHGGSWAEYDPDYLRTIMRMEMHYKNNFSMEAVMIQYQEAIIKRMDHYVKVFARRGK